MQKANLCGGCLSLESLSGPELQPLAHQSKSTSCLVKNWGSDQEPTPDMMQWGEGTHTAPSSQGTPHKDLS